MKDNKIGEEVLKEMILEMINTTTTVEDAIKEKIEEDKVIKEGFKELNKSYNTISSNRLRVIYKLKLSKIHLQLFQIYLYIISSKNDATIKNCIEKIDKTTLYFKSQKNLLLTIKDAIKELEKNNVSTCNYDINTLLSLIYNKNQLLIDELNESLKKYETSMEGITYISNKSRDSQISQIDEEINEYIKCLGLKIK